MKTLTYTTRHHDNRENWPKGPWDNEPDKMQWVDEATGRPCLVVRNPLGALCGYVGVPPSHPLHGKHYHEVDLKEGVHGGLTFSDRCNPGEREDTGICHLPEPGEPDDVWWFGFDCSHGWDITPGMQMTMSFPDVVYRTFEYVRRECAALAAQL
jgi:hypothetical protein